MHNILRKNLTLKLFLSYLAIIALGMLVLAAVVEFVIPGAFQRHMASMQGEMTMMGGSRMEMYDNFRSGVNEALAVAAAVSAAAALLLSSIVSRALIRPISAISHASEKIASGHFEHRIQINKTLDSADDLDRLALQFNNMAERLEQSENLRRQLLADVSHEMRTPLTAIKGSLEALADGVLPPNQETYTQIEQEANRLQRLVSDLQELSRVEGGAYRLEKHSVSVSELIESTRRRIERLCTAKQITVNTQVSPQITDVNADPERLLQVLTILLDNACQYTPQNGHIKIVADRDNSMLVVKVVDDGIGIPAEHLPYLFTRFYRVDKSRTRQFGGGSGIGLTIARHLVEAHNGKITAHSDGLGKGSTFTVRLPL